MTKSTIKKRLDFWENTLDKLMTAYEALVSGGVKSYSIDDRQLTKFDLPVLRSEIEAAESKINALNSELKGNYTRKAFGVIPTDW